jgi:hypothetical protein
MQRLVRVAIATLSLTTAAAAGEQYVDSGGYAVLVTMASRTST